MPTSHMYYVCVCCLFMAAAASECGAGESCAVEEDVSALFQSSVETQGSQPSDVDEDGVKEDEEEAEEVGVGTDLLETEQDEDAVHAVSLEAQGRWPENTVCRELHLRPIMPTNGDSRRRRCMCRRRHGPPNKMGSRYNIEYPWYPTTGFSCVGTAGDDHDNLVYNYKKSTFRYGFFKLGDVWLTHCPPGYIATGGGLGGTNAGGKCEVCRGMAARRRGSKEGTPTCTQCPRGYISQDGSDDCQHIQDTCDGEQCNSCKACLTGAQTSIGPAIKKCVEAKSGKKCFHPGKEWCGKAQRGLFECQKYSLGCFYLFLCNSACICKDWKNVFCGGRVGNNKCDVGVGLLEGNSTPEVPVEEAALMQKRADVTTEGDAVSLDDAMDGKRTTGPPPPC